MSTPESIVLTSGTKRRSRGGCGRCRKRRQKCDQAQPSCSRCSDAETKCAYQLHIRWGGRDFSRSSFGKCGAQRIGKRQIVVCQGSTPYSRSNQVQTDMPKELEPGKFVYGAKDGKVVRSTKQDTEKCQRKHLQTPPRPLLHQHSPAAVPVPRVLPERPDIEPQVRAQLHYFVHKGSAAILTHRQIQEEACSALIPAALMAPALLYAISAFAAAQQATYAHDAHDRMRLNMDELQSRMRSIRILQEGMAGGQATSPAVVLGSSLMLCLCTLYGGNDDYGSWRIYLQGARAAFAASCSRGGERSGNESNKGRMSGGEAENGNNPLARYLRKRYNLLEVLAMLSTNSFEALELGDGDKDYDYDYNKASLRGDTPEPPQVFFDDHVACYTDLFNLLRVIGAVAWERRQRKRQAEQDQQAGTGKNSGSSSRTAPANNLLSEADFAAEADNLETEVRRMMARNRKTPPVLRPSVRAALDPSQIAEFALCNEVHEQYALLQIRAEIRGWPSDDPRVQQPVQQILELATRMQLRSGLSPALGLNTPLFGAGQHATTLAQQETVRSLLEGLYTKTHNRNLLLAVRRLQADYWEQPAPQAGSWRPVLPCLDFIAY
ncbi:c6 zinc finger domain containing protein [Grosmannia clavigera kw1407]|uniref:C6 zinc finger domain containing protein n=1 Tax=Grosmannia clavigera (strain kw1407 / UAMH 11150) TaxID=655863 RepID=F0XE39_GROCL|nr:c6 zinc finger domain containing protein [Grosmannia clavigera kw1407]EFX04287.1 c6 zinc finger domain containing protein [Grosmannia clavigera kw1407]